MRDRQDELVNTSGEQIDVVVVTFTKARNLNGYQRRFAAPFTVVTDVDLDLYKAMGFGRGSVWRIWGLKAAKRYRDLLKSGYRLERSTIHSRGEDTLQLGGNVIVDSSGVVAWLYQGAGPDDRPSIDELVRQAATVS